MIWLVLAALALSALPAPAALAQTSTPAPAAAQAPAVKPGDQVICKRVDVSGTRIQLPKKCMTRRDWERMDGPGKDDIQAVVRANLTRNGTGG